MKCDLHVHTRHSGLCTIPVARRFCRESYTEPEALYRRLKALGMDLVTVTDHDSIDAAESLRRYPDFFLSEEVTCTLPSGGEAHIGVYGITERNHVELQRRRTDPGSLGAYIRERRLLASINHAFSGLTGRRRLTDYQWFAQTLPAIETRNGAMLRSANRHARSLCRWLGKAPLGGSDAHILETAGSTWTRVAGASCASEYLAGLRSGLGSVQGKSGGYRTLTRSVFQIGCELMKENRWATVLAPFLALVPLATLINYGWEAAFAWRWNRKVRAAWGIPSPTPRRLAETWEAAV